MILHSFMWLCPPCVLLHLCFLHNWRPDVLSVAQNRLLHYHTESVCIHAPYIFSCLLPPSLIPSWGNIVNPLVRISKFYGLFPGNHVGLQGLLYILYRQDLLYLGLDWGPSNNPRLAHQSTYLREEITSSSGKAINHRAGMPDSSRSPDGPSNCCRAWSNDFSLSLISLWHDEYGSQTSCIDVLKETGSNHLRCTA